MQSMWRVQLFIELSYHLPGNVGVLDMGVAINEAAALFTQLGRRHLDLASALNQFLEIVSH